MPTTAQPSPWTRARRKAGRIAVRARERVAGLPLRAAERRNGLPVPPGRLIHLVANTEDVGWFLGTGALAAASIREVLARHGSPLERMGEVLDFGCGAGRVIRQWNDIAGPWFHGTDYNPALVGWCRDNLPFARFAVNGLDRPLDYVSGQFDLIYALSVFTHLAEPLQQFWIGELTRILAPGGMLLITTHGDHYLPMLEPAEQERYRAGGMVVHKARSEGSNDCAAFHPPAYVREHLARGLNVAEMVPEGARGNPSQDLWLLRKPDR